MTSTTTDPSSTSLFDPTSLGAIQLKNRVVMAPLTRMRATDGGVPGDLMVEHYGQRASAGLIITEGTFPSRYSQAYAGEPGIETAEQAAGWGRVADAVHERGGAIVLQIMHGGRMAHPALNGGQEILAPSAIAINGEMYAGAEKVPFATPKAMTSGDVASVIAEHVAAARRAVDAGLDGVEIHSANGYLLHQFLAPGSNQRTDEYGGSAENRARFTVEVVTAVAAEIGADRVGLRISPAHNIQDALETDPDDVLSTYGALIDQVAPLGLAYLSILHGEPRR